MRQSMSGAPDPSYSWTARAVGARMRSGARNALLNLLDARRDFALDRLHTANGLAQECGQSCRVAEQQPDGAGDDVFRDAWRPDARHLVRHQQAHADAERDEEQGDQRDTKEPAKRRANEM